MSRFIVPDLSCGHCEKAITTELKRENPSVKVDVDLITKVVTVNDLPDDRVLFLLKEIGYNPQKME